MLLYIGLALAAFALACNLLFALALGARRLKVNQLKKAWGGSIPGAEVPPLVNWLGWNRVRFASHCVMLDILVALLNIFAGLSMIFFDPYNGDPGLLLVFAAAATLVMAFVVQEFLK